MMSMDALMKEGFAPANFCDTSGNPPACKVYRAAKILLTQPGIVGYFATARRGQPGAVPGARASSRPSARWT